MDTVTLRVTFGLVAACVLALFYGVTYRSTRSAYSGWWCLSLACFIVSALLFALNGTPVQVAANPLGNAMGVLGAGCVWAGARSLGGRTVPLWPLVSIAALVLSVSLLDDPAGNTWSGGIAYLLAMAGFVGGSAYDLRRLLGQRDTLAESNDQVRFAVSSMAVASGVIGAYYLVRAGVFASVGPEHPVFAIGFGGQTTTMLTMLLLVVVTFGMSALSHEQQTSDLRVRATRDALTGLLNRSEFLIAAERDVRGRRRGSEAALVIADLDRFKSLNDTFGHAAGDQALIDFAASCQAVVGSRGLVGRLGGDEFVLLVDNASAEKVAAAVGERYGCGTPRLTASFGIATVPVGAELATALAAADAALYRAKVDGRGRAVRDVPDHREWRTA